MNSQVCRVSLSSKLESIAALAEQVDSLLADHPRLAFQVNLCLDELLTNTITHGLKGAPDHRIEVELKREAEWLEIVLSDDAPPYDPFADSPRPDLEAELDERPIGGLGVHFVRSLMQSAEVSHEGGGNRVVLRKRLCETDA